MGGGQHRPPGESQTKTGLWGTLTSLSAKVQAGLRPRAGASELPAGGRPSTGDVRKRTGTAPGPGRQLGGGHGTAAREPSHRGAAQPVRAACGPAWPGHTQPRLPFSHAAIRTPSQGSAALTASDVRNTL